MVGVRALPWAEKVVVGVRHYRADSLPRVETGNAASHNMSPELVYCFELGCNPRLTLLIV